MNSFELNKIFGAILGTLVFVMGVGFIADEIYAPIEGRGAELDEESRALLEAVKRLNEVNRRMRNLIAANVQARLTALTGGVPVYQAERSSAVGGATR